MIKNGVTRAMSGVMLILLLLIGLVAPAAAQGNPLVNCNGLSEADCTLLQDAAAASSTLRSFSMPAWSVRLELNAGEESVRFASSGSGRIVIPPALLALLSEIPSDLTDTAGLLAFYRALNAEMLAGIFQDAGLQMVFDQAEIRAPGETLIGKGDLLFKDSGLYLHLYSPTGADAWFGEPVRLTQAQLQELSAALESIQEQFGSADAQAALEQANALNLLLNPIGDILNAHITTARGPDEELHGQPVAAFTTTVDLKGFLADPALARQLLSALQDPQIGALLGAEMGDLGQINAQQVQLVLFLASTLLGKTSVTASVWVGLDDGYFHKLAFDVTLDVNLSLLGDETLQQIAGGLAFFSEIDDINTATLDDVVLPRSAWPLETTSEFLAGTPALIEGTLALGSRYVGSFAYEGNQEDVLALVLAAGDTINLVLESEDNVYVDLYGPDGFLVETFDTYYGKLMPITAERAGTYVVVVRSYWDMLYALMVEAR